MKQHISVEQLKELSNKGKKGLSKWWKPDIHAEQILTSKGIISMGTQYRPEKKWSLPLLSIGQMIEYLDQQGTKDISMNEWSHEYYVFRDGGTIEIEWMGKTELCDALWEAVKEVLEK